MTLKYFQPQLHVKKKKKDLFRVISTILQVD